MDIVLFGIQGSGKGTQAKELAADFSYSIFETGAELRTIAAMDTELGHTVKSYIDQGLLAPLEIVMQVVKAAIISRSGREKILFDGIPRDLDQQKGFDAIMSETGRDFVCVQILLDAETCVQRILARAAEQGRADDAQEETIRRRMAIFGEKTVPVISAYRTKGKLIDVDGNGSVDEVYARLKAALGL